MRIKFEFDVPGNTITLPVNYNHLVQAMIYKNISPKLADFLHAHGFLHEKRQFKLFTFSKLFGNFRIQKNTDKHTLIRFNSPVHFYLSAPFGQILQEFANKMVTGISLDLGGTPLSLSSVEVLLPPVFKGKVTTVKTLSPITVRSTRLNEDGTKKTHYYSPLETAFSQHIRENLLKKYYSFLGQYPGNSEFHIRPFLFSERRNFHLVMYKGYVVKGYSGIYELEGNRELIQFAYDTGLGERNSQGFGMFDKWEKEGP